MLILAALPGAADGPLVLLAVAVFVLGLVSATVDWFLVGDGERVHATRASCC